MGEPHPPARCRHADLTPMQVTTEDQVEGRSGEPIDDVWEVAEQEPKSGMLVRQPVWARTSLPERVGRDADDGAPLARKLDVDRVVREEPRLLEVAELGGPRERVPRHGDVMVAEHDEGSIETSEQLTEDWLAARMRHEISGDADDVRPALGHPGRRSR